MYNNIEYESINVTLETLRNDRKKAIAQHNYKRAQQIEEEMNSLKNKRKSNDKSAKIAANQNSLENEKQKLRNAANTLRSEFTQRIYATKAAYQRRYLAILDKQQEEVKKLATDFAKDIEYAQTRRVPEHMEMMRVSQLRADASQYAIANQLSEEANFIRNNTLLQRQDTVHHSYQTQQDTLIKNQQNETNGHVTKLKNELNLLQMEYKKEIAKLKQALITHGITFGITVTPQEAEDFFRQYEIVDDDESTSDPTPTIPQPITPSPLKTRRTQFPTSPRSPRTPRSSGLRSPFKSPKYKKSPVSK